MLGGCADVQAATSNNLDDPRNSTLRPVGVMRGPVADRRQFERDELLENRAIQGATRGRRHAQRLQPFPLIGRKIVVEFRVSCCLDTDCFRGVLQSQRERDATIMRRDFDSRQRLLPTGSGDRIDRCR